MAKSAKMTKSQKIELLALLEEKQRRKAKRVGHDQWSTLYDWQKGFVAATSEYTACCLCAANRVGKTRTGLLIDSFHLTGDYPKDWNGHRFDHPPLIWLLGITGEKTRDLLQTPLFGVMEDGKLSGGLIHKDLIVSHKSMTGTSGGLREVCVKYKNGGMSRLQFWSYSQGQHVLMGDSVDWYHIDEEPRDQTIYPQVLTRTATGDKGKGGRGILTFTPENGRTDLVVKFMDDPTANQFFMKKGWDDAPHLSESVKESLIAQFPEHQREMRTKGEPMLGHGRIYDVSDQFVECDPFDIPEHFNIINGMDFGWDHPQAFTQLAHDLDNDIIYVTNSWKQARVSANDAWGATKDWAAKFPTAWPHDGLMHEKGRDDSLQQKAHYQNAGFNLLHEYAQWPEGGNSVENGLYEILQRARNGKLKIFRGQSDLMNEWRQYHRDDKGKIVKVHDDILDSLRYAYMMRRYAMRKGDLHNKPRVVIPQPLGRRA